MFLKCILKVNLKIFMPYVEFMCKLCLALISEALISKVLLGY